MLIQLSIRDIVLIEKLDLEFDAGLSVLTGETGAGKSILLDSAFRSRLVAAATAASCATALTRGR
jgi:DNA repair ATPase RecN